MSRHDYIHQRILAAVIGERRWMILLIVVAIAMRLALLFRPDDLFNTRPFIEDAYYSLSVARSLAHGTGLSVDGVQPTNGIQPLIVFFYAPFFVVLDDDLALRACFLFCILIEGMLAYAMMKIVEACSREPVPINARRIGLLAVVLYYWSYSTSVYTLNGLETALAVLCTVGVLLFYRSRITRTSEPRVLDFITLGFVMGLMVLARIDTGFFAALLIGHYLVQRSAGTLRTRVTRAILAAAVCGITTLPWWWYNLAYFGNVIPTSGLSQSVRIPIGENFTALIQYVLNRSLVIGYLPYTPQLSTLHFAIGSAVVVVAIICFVRYRRGTIMREVIEALRGRWHFEPLALAILFAASMAVYYCGFFGAPHFLQRYLFIVQVVELVVVAMILGAVFSALERRSMFVAKVCKVGGALALVSIFLIPYSWNYRTSIAQQNDFYQVSRWIAQHTDADDRVGMGQSGTTGFFNHNVVNLDGKVNFGVMKAIEQGKYCEYVSSARFTYLIDWDKFFEDLSSCALLQHYSPVDTVGRFYIYRRHDRARESL